MSARGEIGIRLRRALRVTVTVFGLRTACALLLAWPLLAELAPALAARAAGPGLRAAEAELLVEAALRSGPRWLFWALGTGLGYALLSPLLAQAWLCAMARDQSTRASFGRAAGQYPRAVALAACALAAWGALLAIGAVALAPAVAAALPEQAWFERAWSIAVVASVALAGLTVTTARDLGCARLALGADLRDALRCGLRELGAHRIGLHALLAAAAAALLAGADVAAREPLSGLVLWLVLALQQGLAFGSALLRGAWLACALLAAESAPAPIRPRS